MKKSCDPDTINRKNVVGWWEIITVKMVHACPLTSKLCAEVWKTGYECSLNSGNENSKLEMETPKFPAKIDFNFHWKSSSLQTETSDQIVYFRF